ncbi:hypothetical protein EYB53_021115 [Candidatus Chloroploca sp. M-50]|uniref:Uncharacterized protein n=1 Tax=Candidatus Chloroploca mongolica TaxID=2528176 RepID=A0ABS4DFM7_9CHLR|nr:hypothetical protein [Candidatus Chloroploca mongolica]MBP1468225.1 hypothetical protein [Candidatus Chloroploca mongolica]
MQRLIATLCLILVAFIALAAIPAAPATAQAGERCFAETNLCISGAMRTYWERGGGLPVFGLPITPQSVELVEGQPLQAQWFERDRLEIQPDGRVTTGRLGVERLAQMGTPWQPGSTTTAEPGCAAFAETGHQVCGAFHSYWRTNGGLERFGLPVTGAFTIELEGRPYTVQFFERRRFELHPDIGPNAVLLGLLGTEVRANAAPTQPISFSGSGQQVTAEFALPAHFTQITFSHDGQRNFIVWAYPSSGSEELLANTIGAYNGTTLLTGAPGDRVYLGVQADGAWTVQISAVGFDNRAVSFSGRGDAVSPLFTPPAQGPQPYAFSHDGQRNFVVWLRCADRDHLAQNTIGHASGTAVVRFERGPCLWEVRGDGNWSITPAR